MIYNSSNKKVRLDAHNDVLMKLSALSNEQQRCFFEEANQDYDVTWSRLQKGKMNGCFYAAFSPGHGSINENHLRTNSQLAALQNLVRIAKQAGIPFYKYFAGSFEKKGESTPPHWAIQTIEGAYAVDERNALALIDQYADIGVKAIGLVWNHENKLGGGAESSGDLSPLGKLVIEKMEQRKIILDVSHMNQRTFWSSLAMSKAPVIASHSGAFALTPHLRNLTDDQILAIAKNGGVINVVFHRAFIGHPKDASIADVADHIQYICKLVGPKFVGIGSDFDGSDTPIGLEHIGEIDKLDALLKQRGVSLVDRRGILGANLARLVAASGVDSFNDNSSMPQVTISPLRHSITDQINEYRVAFRIDPSQMQNAPSTQCESVQLKLWINGILWPLEKSLDHTYHCLVPMEEITNFPLVTIAYGNSQKQRKTQIVDLK